MRATVVCLLVGYVAFALSSTVPFSDNSSSLVKELETDSLLDIWGGEMVNLVGFYDKENATASTHFATVWEGLATQHAGLFSFSAADGGGKLSFILETLKIKKLPSVLAFPSKLTSSKALPQTYKGPINESSISKWALKQLPHTLVYKIASESNMNTFKGYTTSKKVCLFHNETDTPPVFRALSLTFADRLRFGEAKMKDKKRAKIGEKEGITEFPKVVVYGAEDSKDKQNFDGPLAMAELKAFLEPHALSLEKREEIRKERKEKYDKEQEEKKAQEEKEKAEKEAKRKEEAAEKKRKRREKRKIVKARDEAYLVMEREWQAEDGELIHVRQTGWDEVPEIS